MIYIHVPFCKSFCTYCGFYSEVVACRENVQDRSFDRFSKYADAVCSEIDARVNEILATLPSAEMGENVDTLYIGGGTPSVLPFIVLDRMVRHLNTKVFGAELHEYQEFTVEVNPDDIVLKGDEYVKSLLSIGVTRISMGVQAFDDNMLRWMNRRHNSSEVEQAMSILRRNGVKNISIDLIFGINGLIDDQWQHSLEKAVELHTEHLSAYQLSLEDGSALASLVDAGKYKEADEEQCRHQYEMLCDVMSASGYRHYEVSNFALPGYEAVHNSAYWRRVPYVGLGPGAHSAACGIDGKLNIRKWNSQSEHSYLPETESLGDEDIRIEKIMLSLRTENGIESVYIPEKQLNAFLADGTLVMLENGRVRIPENRFFVSDEIIRELI